RSPVVLRIPLYLPSSKKTMEEPLCPFAVVIMSGAVQPVPVPLIVLHAVVITVFSRIHPPFPLNAFRSIGLLYRMYFSPIPEQHGRIVRYRGRNLNALRLSQ